MAGEGHAEKHPRGKSKRSEETKAERRRRFERNVDPSLSNQPGCCPRAPIRGKAQGYFPRGCRIERGHLHDGTDELDPRFSIPFRMVSALEMIRSNAKDETFSI